MSKIPYTVQLMIDEGELGSGGLDSMRNPLLIRGFLLNGSPDSNPKALTTYQKRTTPFSKYLVRMESLKAESLAMFGISSPGVWMSKGLPKHSENLTLIGFLVVGVQLIFVRI